MNQGTTLSNSYRSEMLFLSTMTLLFGISCIFFGYILLPFAAAFYAALLACEKKEGRILSYVLPLIPLTLSVFILDTFYSIETIAYVVIGLILYLGFEKKHNKATTVMIAVVSLIFMMLISLLLLALNEVVKFEAVGDFYTNLYNTGKMYFVDYMTSTTSVDSLGLRFYNYNAGEVIALYNSLIISLIPAFVIFALISIGLSVRIFGSRVSRYNPKDVRLLGWKFVTTPFLAYSYIVLTAFSSLSQSGLIGVSIYFVASILMPIYFYIGVSAAFGFIAKKKNSKFAVLVIAVSFFVLTSLAMQIISFIGVFVNNFAYNKDQKTKNTDI